MARDISLDELPTAIASWLIGTDSLTRRLRAMCGSAFRVRVIGQRRQRPLPSERAMLNLPDHAWALVRQVQLLCASRALIYARTIMPEETLKGARRRFAHLGNRPLGEMLFADRRIQRGEMEVAHIEPGHELHALAVGRGSAGIWGRRSVFLIDDHPLLVNEIFLPGILRTRR
jgi:chorismate lyase